MPVSATPYKRNETSLGIDVHSYMYFQKTDICTTYLILQSTLPLGKIRMQTFGTRILWKRPSFSFRKNVSGIHTFLASVIVRYWILAVTESRFYNTVVLSSSHSSNAYNSLQNPPTVFLFLPWFFFCYSIVTTKNFEK